MCLALNTFVKHFCLSADFIALLAYKIKINQSCKAAKLPIIHSCRISFAGLSCIVVAVFPRLIFAELRLFLQLTRATTPPILELL